jgi:hypothetical protein
MSGHAEMAVHAIPKTMRAVVPAPIFSGSTTGFHTFRHSKDLPRMSPTVVEL